MGTCVLSHLHTANMYLSASRRAHTKRKWSIDCISTRKSFTLITPWLRA